MADNIHMQLHYNPIVEFRIWIKLFFFPSQKGKILYRKFFNLCLSRIKRKSFTTSVKYLSFYSLVNAGMHYMTFAQIFAPIYTLDELTLFAESHHRLKILGSWNWQISQKIAF